MYQLKRVEPKQKKKNKMFCTLFQNKICLQLDKPHTSFLKRGFASESAGELFGEVRNGLMSFTSKNCFELFTDMQTLAFI